MSIKTKVIIGSVAFIVLVVMIFVFSLIGLNNQFVGHERGLVAQYEQNQNVYDNYFKKVKEVAQVPDKYAEDFKEVYDGIMKGRYGEEGSKAAFQWIQENNPQLDPGLYKQIQQVIEAGRNEFQANQAMLLDKKRVYEIALGTFPNSFLAGILGYPKIDMKDITIVTSDVTEKIFKDKKSDPITF